MQENPAVRQAMALLPQSDEDEHYDQNEIQTDHYTQKREISVIEGFWPCVHIKAFARFLVLDYRANSNKCLYLSDGWPAMFQTPRLWQNLPRRFYHEMFLKLWSYSVERTWR